MAWAMVPKVREGRGGSGAKRIGPGTSGVRVLESCSTSSYFPFLPSFSWSEGYPGCRVVGRTSSGKNITARRRIAPGRIANVNGRNHGMTAASATERGVGCTPSPDGPAGDGSGSASGAAALTLLT